MQKRVFRQQDSFTFQLTRFRSQRLCFTLWCLFKLTVSSVVLFWPRVTFSSGDLLWAGANCIITKATAVNLLLQESIRISFMHKTIDVYINFTSLQPDLPFSPPYCGVKDSIQECGALRDWISYVISLKDNSQCDLGITVASVQVNWKALSLSCELMTL